MSLDVPYTNGFLQSSVCILLLLLPLDDIFLTLKVNVPDL